MIVEGKRLGTPSSMLELVGLTKSYDGRRVIDDVSLTVRDDEYLTCLGPSGSGKSTLLRLIAGIETPDAGTIRLDGRDVTHLAPHLRGLGFVQQKYALFPHLTVHDNVAFGLRHRQVDPLCDEAAARAKVREMLALVGLGDLGDRMTGQISGGQKQRVSLARTLVTEPRICLLDEPLGALDANLRERMTVELRRIRRALGVSFVHATGNETEALAMGDRMVVLDEGRAPQTGTPDEIYERPATVRVARSLNAYNILEGEGDGGRFVHPAGDLPLPPGLRDVRHYAVHFDAIAIIASGNGEGRGDEAARPPDLQGLDATFVTSEFVGSTMIYFFRAADGSILEVEQHLSKSDPIDFARRQPCRLAWRVEDVLGYDRHGNLLSPVPDVLPERQAA